MPQIAKRKPGDRYLPARDWNSVADAVNGGITVRPPAFASVFDPTVLVRNDTGADLAMFECISLGDPLYELETDGSVDLIFAGETADPMKPAAILTEPIAHDAVNPRYGRAILFGKAYALVGAAAATTILRATPDAANDRLAPDPSGSVILLAAPSTSTTKLLPVLLGASGDEGTGLAKTPAGGISAMSGVGTVGDPWVFGSGTCKKVTIDFADKEGVASTEDIVIYNMVPLAVAGDVLIQWKRIGRLPFVDVEPCS